MKSYKVKFFALVGIIVAAVILAYTYYISNNNGVSHPLKDWDLVLIACVMDGDTRSFSIANGSCSIIDSKDFTHAPLKYRRIEEVASVIARHSGKGRVVAIWRSGETEYPIVPISSEEFQKLKQLLKEAGRGDLELMPPE